MSTTKINTVIASRVAAKQSQMKFLYTTSIGIASSGKVPPRNDGLNKLNPPRRKCDHAQQ